jgi:hypothetical protein
MFLLADPRYTEGSLTSRNSAFSPKNIFMVSKERCPHGAKYVLINTSGSATEECPNII